DQYADAVEAIARVDLAYVPAEADDAARRDILGTVMIAPVLAALRLHAQRQVAITAEGAESRPPGSRDAAAQVSTTKSGVPGRLRWVTMVPPADGRVFGGRVSPRHAPPGTGARPLAATGPPRRGMRVHRAEGADTAGPPPSLLSEP